MQLVKIESRYEDDESPALSGDSGGKAELLRLLEVTKQPVILACNDIMEFMGSLFIDMEEHERSLQSSLDHRYL